MALRKFLRLKPEDRRLLVKAVMLVAAVRGGLSILPFATLRRLVGRLMVPMRGARHEQGVVDTIAWAVPAVSRYIPRATCLTQALSAQVLLARRGFPTELRIGVARDSRGAFNAHAWVEHNGRIVVGELGYEEFTPLPTFDVRDR